MALKLDDLLVKKKEPVQILDLSKSTANSKEELKKLLEKVPDYKIKMDKIRPEEVKIYDKKFSFKSSKKEEKSKTFPFTNPVPSEMKALRLEDLCSVNIQWKMLTSLRPRSKLDEEYFTRLIDLGKLQLQAREKERKRPFVSFIKKSKNKAGILETKIISCRDCGEEFCVGETCRVFAYDSYERISNFQITGDELTTQETKEKKKKFKKKSKKKIPKKNLKSKQVPTQTKPSSTPQPKKLRPSVTANKIKKTQPSPKARTKIQKIPSADTKTKLNKKSSLHVKAEKQPKKKSTKSKKKK